MDEIGLDDSMENKCELPLLLDAESCLMGFSAYSSSKPCVLSAGVSAGRRTIQVTKAFQVNTLAADATHLYNATRAFCKCLGRRHPAQLLATPG